MVQFSLVKRFPDRLYPLDIMMVEIVLYTLIGIFTQQKMSRTSLFAHDSIKKQEQVYKNKN